MFFTVPPHGSTGSRMGLRAPGIRPLSREIGGGDDPPKGGPTAGDAGRSVSYDGSVFHLRRPSGSIIGRADDVRGVLDELDRSRLVSLVGPGGVGKTALAAEVIHELEPDFERVLAVELADAGHPGDVLRLLAASALDEATLDPERVARAVDAAHTLVVLDNCEHVVDEAAEVVDALLHATARVAVVTTSRRPLDIAAEVIWTVRPLEVPQFHDNHHDLVATPAVQLFLERVYHAVPTFELTDTNRAIVAEICAAADGIPLVLELAAALVRTRSLQEILHAMSSRPTSLTSPRRDLPEHQRSVSKSLDWSRQFLDEADSRLLDRLSVFVGGFTAQAARAVAGDDADGLDHLVDHSLIGFDPATGRYRILEVVRVAAAERLEPDERADVERRHLDWSRSIVGQIEEARFDADPDGRFPLFELELPNLCAAVRRCHKAGDLDGFRALLGPIAVWWVHYLPPEDAGVWTTAFADPATPVQWRANVDSALAFHLSHRGRHAAALETARRAVRLHDEAGDLIGRALAEVAAANALLALGDPQAARTAYESALATALRTGHPYPELVVRVSLARLDPDDPTAEQHLVDALPIARRGFPSLESIIGAELGVRALRAGRLADARRLSDEALDRARSLGFGEGLATALCAVGEVAAARGETSAARSAFREALAIGRQSMHEGVSIRAADGLASLPADQEHHRSDATPQNGEYEELSDRELAVARLLRGDLTQREIADELYIAPSTVKTHIKAIYRKLGVSKRSHAITRAGELGLFSR